MDIAKLHKIFDILLRDEFAMVYSGDFTNTTLTPLTDLINAFLADEHSDLRKVHKKVAYMTIENFQNIVRYSETRDVKQQQGDVAERDLIQLRIIGSDIFIISSNLVHKNRANAIKENLDKLNSMDRTELNALFVEKLKNNTFNERGGAGLGFIEMIRKTKNKLFYKFVPYNDEFVRFYFQIQISRGGQSDANLLECATEIYDLVKDMHIDFLFKSKIGEGRLKPLISMIQDSISSQNQEYFRNVLSISVEMLQDIFSTSRRSELMKDAVFIFGFNDISENNYFAASSFMNEPILIEKINTINYFLSLSPEKIKQEYFNFLTDDSVTDEQLRFLGIFNSGVNFEYLVDMENKNKPFFIEKVEVENVER